MKKLFVLSLFGFVFIACGNGKDIPQSEVPSVVINNFKTQFPNAVDMEWEAYGKNYQIEYEVERVDYLAFLDPQGKILRYAYELPFSKLPDKVNTALEKNYPDKQLEEVRVLKIGPNTYFQVELEGWFRDHHKMFTASGKENNNVHYWHE